MTTTKTIPAAKLLATSSEIDRTRNAEYLRLTPECVRECGVNAAITLAAFYRTARSGDFYRHLKTLADQTQFDVRTTKRHLAKLESKGWIENKGREHRRACTRKITNRVKDSANDWSLVLPAWTMSAGLRESELALVAIAFHRFRGMTNEVNGDDGAWLSVDPCGEFEWSTKYIRELTGLHRGTIYDARKSLIERGMIQDGKCPHGKVVLAPVHDGSECDKEPEEISVFALVSEVSESVTRTVGICPSGVSESVTRTVGICPS